LCLLQKIIPLPFDSALKYTIARYFTPSGRCIQAIKYSGGREEVLLTSNSPGPKDPATFLEPPSSQIQKPLPNTQLLSAPKPPLSPEEEGQGQAIPDSDRHSFFTKFRHRPVRDGGGIEPDFKVPFRSNFLNRVQWMRSER